VIAFSPPKSATQIANDRLESQTKHDGERSREPAERFINCSAVLTFETSRRSLFPSLARGVNETAVQFADRVRTELLKLQGVVVPESKP
jgi:hypothetical protein